MIDLVATRFFFFFSHLETWQPLGGFRRDCGHQVGFCFFFSLGDLMAIRLFWETWQPTNHFLFFHLETQQPQGQFFSFIHLKTWWPLDFLFLFSPHLETWLPLGWFFLSHLKFGNHSIISRDLTATRSFLFIYCLETWQPPSCFKTT